jgi:ATP-dependent DNA ligase
MWIIDRVIKHPVEPMLAKLAEELPPADGFLFEPKWDGFRAIVFRGAADVFIQSRDLRGRR